MIHTSIHIMETGLGKGKSNERCVIKPRKATVYPHQLSQRPDHGCNRQEEQAAWPMTHVTQQCQNFRIVLRFFLHHSQIQNKQERIPDLLHYIFTWCFSVSWLCTTSLRLSARLPASRANRGEGLSGLVSIVMEVTQNGWFWMEHPNIKWMMSGGTPISGSLHMVFET